MVNVKQRSFKLLKGLRSARKDADVKRRALSDRLKNL